MKILGIIPARGGSKGVPGKNIKTLGGKPLIQYSIESAHSSKLLSSVILSSEDYDIIETAKKLKLSVPFIRPAELSKDSAKSIDVVKHAIEFFENQGEFYDAICLIQATYPFRNINFIDEAIRKFIDGEVDTLISVLSTPDEHNPHWSFVHDDKGNLKIATGEKQIISRRQELPKSFYRDGSIYLTKTKFIKQSTFFGDSIGYIESNAEFYVNIDTISDWNKAEALVEKYKLQSK